MKAYFRIMFSSEGASPGEVESALAEMGLIRIKGSSVFETEVKDDAELMVKLEKLHESLRGLEIGYSPSIQMPEGGPTDAIPGCKERLEKWRATGIGVDELTEALERDVEEFRERAKEMWGVQIERIADEWEREMAELEAKRKLDEARERILREVGAEGKSFHDLTGLVDIDAEVLSDILDDLVEKGRIKARQKKRQVVFVQA
jgi:predicted transcriptional regulator